MSTFITKAACRGRRPAPLLDYNGYKRPHLVARLLKERDVHFLPVKNTKNELHMHHERGKGRQNDTVDSCL